MRRSFFLLTLFSLSFYWTGRIVALQNPPSRATRQFFFSILLTFIKINVIFSMKDIKTADA